MTDHQTMIREVCEGLGKGPLRDIHGILEIGEYDPDWAEHTWSEFKPDLDYADTHLLIDWMVEAGWDVCVYILRPENGMWVCEFQPKGRLSGCVKADDPDFRIAVLTAAWRAVTNAG